MSQEAAENEKDASPFDLARFVQAQASVYSNVRAELKNGRKQTHWMWYIFPQAAGLGYSATSQRYAIQSLAEAQAYLAHPLLGSRLRECAELVLTTEGRSAKDIFGSPDDAKLRSSMTLFAQVHDTDAVFGAVLAKYFDGQPDSATLRLLAASETN